MRALLLGVALIGILGCARWTKTDIAFEAAFFVAAGIDWHQTADITRDCRELNPVIGECGERMPRTLYFSAVLALHVLIAAALPPRWRSLFQGVTLGVEAATIYYNVYAREGDRSAGRARPVRTRSAPA